jgi:hypothetical protein
VSTRSALSLFGQVHLNAGNILVVFFWPSLLIMNSSCARKSQVFLCFVATLLLALALSFACLCGTDFSAFSSRQHCHASVSNGTHHIGATHNAKKTISAAHEKACAKCEKSTTHVVRAKAVAPVASHDAPSSPCHNGKGCHCISRAPLVPTQNETPANRAETFAVAILPAPPEVFAPTETTREYSPRVNSPPPKLCAAPQSARAPPL